MQKLTSCQAEILSSIKHCLEGHGFPPIQAEIVQELGFKSLNITEEHLKVLARKGVIEMTPGTSHGIRIPGLEPHAANDGEDLPVIGRVATGAPILAEQNIEGSCRINPAFFNPRTDYLLRVRDMSMKDIGILDGDLLAAHVTRETRDGRVVIVRIDEKVTVKRFERGGSEAWLLAENLKFAPIEVDLKEKELIIGGSNVGVV